MDVILISCSKTQDLINTTVKAIKSCRQTSDDNIIVVETSGIDVTYKGIKTIQYDSPYFNYNRAVNLGLKESKSDYVLFANNDIVFYDGWDKELIKQMKKHKAGSASPFCTMSDLEVPKKAVVEGYNVRKELMGWSICLSRDTINKIKVLDCMGILNEDYTFWGSEDTYINQLKDKGIKHILCRDSRVDHEHNGSVTLKTLNAEEQNKITYGIWRDEKFKLCLHKTKFSIVLPSYLGEYEGAAKNRPEKLRRAIDSVLKQSFKHWELIIVSDGCDETVDIYKEYKDSRIKCYKVAKQKVWSGVVRTIGIDKSQGEYIIYLDSDDYYGKNHLKVVNDNLKGSDWVYFNDIAHTSQGKSIRTTDIVKGMGFCGTSTICHKRAINVDWMGCDSYAHDFRFIKKLKEYPNHNHIGNSFYHVCHVPDAYDN